MSSPHNSFLFRTAVDVIYPGYKWYSIHLGYEWYMLSFPLCLSRFESPSPWKISGSVYYCFPNMELFAGCKKKKTKKQRVCVGAF